MTNKSTKKALALSIISLVVCVSMLVGTTFAWFTDSVTSANNIIKSGNLDIELEYWNGTDWVDVAGKSNILTNTLWEPGVTEVAYLRVANAGSLALKYQLGVNIVSEKAGKNVAGEEFKLSNYIQFGVVENVNGESGAYANREAAVAAVTDAKKISAGYTKAGSMTAGAEKLYLALVVWMPTTVGNEANHDGTNVPEINLGINVLATQYTAESDSFNNQYDKDAWHPDFVVTNSDELKVALTNGGNIALANDVIISESLPVTKDTVLDLNGKTIGTSGSTTGSPLYLQGGKLTVKNGTLDLDGSHTNVNGTFSTAIGYDAQTELVVENVNFTGTTAINGTFATDGPLKIAISDCTMDVTNVGIAVSANSTEAIATINNCNIDADVYAIFASQGSKITINGGTYKSAGKVITSMYDNTVVTINGGTFDGELWVTGGGSLVIYGGTFTADPSAYVANGYVAVKNADDTYTVLPKVEGAELTYYADGLYSDANSSKNYYVASGAGMDTVAEKINDGTMAKNTNITLLTDIDLTDVDYAPISGNKGDSWYTGTFDGQNHTITGMTVNAYEGGLIGSSNGTVKNVIIDGATVTGSYHAAGIVGTGYGSIQNCTVKNSAIIGNYAGALRGYSASGTNTGNTVENCTINGKYAAGGLFGLVTADGKNTISDNTVKNCDIYCEVPAGNSYNGIGEVVGRSASDKVVIENNMTENVTLH